MALVLSEGDFVTEFSIVGLVWGVDLKVAQDRPLEWLEMEEFLLESLAKLLLLLFGSLI